MRMKNIIIEKFDVNPEQGVAGFICACRKKGYEVLKMVRKGTKAIVTYQKIK